jgi:subtilase family serine protease
MKPKIIPVIIAGLLALACGQITINIGQSAPVSTPVIETPAISLPDLMITSSLISMVDINGNCLGRYDLTAMLFNQGSAPAPDVIVEELMSGQLIYVGTLESQQSMVLQFSASPNGRYRIMIDPQNQIMESDEANNIVTPPSTPATPPGYCLPDLIRTPTTTPYPLYPLAPTPTPAN